MIKLDKLPEPDVLRDNKLQWTQEYKAAKESRSINMDELRNRYRHPTIKEQIVRETYEKCIYCESKIRHTYPGDIEHIKPQAKFEDEIFEWKNLTLACGECNRRKSDNFDDEGGIINPYEANPEDHLLAHGPLIFPRPGDTAGKLTSELLELNRLELIERRKDKMENLQLRLELYAVEENEILKRVYKRKIDEEKQASKEYAMIARAFLKLAKPAKPQRRTGNVSENSPDNLPV